MINIDLINSWDFELIYKMYDEHMGDNNLKKLLDKIMKMKGLIYHNEINEKLGWYSCEGKLLDDVYQVTLSKDDVIYLLAIIDRMYDLEPQFIYSIDDEEAKIDGYIPADELEDYELEDEEDGKDNECSH